jgi:hypothetical protein
MSKKNSTTLAIVQALRGNDETKHLSFDALHGMAEKFFNSVAVESLADKIFDATVSVPGDNPPGAKKYPSREETTPTPVSVPDPAETETATATKISIPDYGDAKRFAVAMGGLADAAQKLFEIASENQQEKDSARRVAFGWHDELRSSIYDL